ncbi:hypothetical protein POTOM_048516 [Populus tomentosa]|uniref:DNAJ heat shock N-terminal domain-containing protein n=1 Tax=Populus tomentosa TaxID=118781 RepID=A0A8X7YFH3_POPTO|nr:hypothetical protein POTOM_048516 [Populus tomentosa]
MAQLISPVCTDALKIKKPSNVFHISSRGKATLYHNSNSRSVLSSKRRDFGRVRVAANSSASADAVADDYYAVLGLLPDATPEQIKKAYYSCMKACHPDLSGDDTDTTNFCMFINEVYAVLSDPLQRMIYDEIHGFALTAMNPFFDDSSPKDHAFVDEFSCIGCKNCANVAPDVFGIEEDFGRARVYSQCGNVQLVQQAIESCPVDCIHWTSAAQLSLLEDEMRRVERINVALMLSGMGSAGADVFRMRHSLLRHLCYVSKMKIIDESYCTTALGLEVCLQSEISEYLTNGQGRGMFSMGKEASKNPGAERSMLELHVDFGLSFTQHNMGGVEQAKIRMMKQKDVDKKGSYWSDLWGNPKENQSSEEETKERARRAAAASRRWREYSRKGVDKPPTFKLPEAISNNDK